MALKIREINTCDQFFELKDYWNKVLKRSRDNHIFLTWEFLSTYVKHFGKETKLKILYIEDKNEIIAIAPLRQSRNSLKNCLGYNVIEPLTYGHTDYTGLVLAERESECLNLFLNYLVERNNWDFIYLFDFPGTSNFPELLSKVPTASYLKVDFLHGAVCPFMSIPESMNLFMNSLSADFRYNIRRYTRKLEKNHQRVELKRYDEIGSVEDTVKIFIDLHQRWWKSKGMPGYFSTQKRRDFTLDVSRRFADNGWLALYFLTVNDEPITALFCFEYNQRMYGTLTGLNPDYFEYSVGNITFAKVIEECIQKKIKEFDFMKGSELYKFKYGANYRRNLNIRFVNRRLTSIFYHLGIQTVKQIKLDKIARKSLDF